MVRKAMAVLLVVLVSACSGGDDGEDLAAVCDDFDALVQADENLPEDWVAFEPVVDRAAEVDELAGAAANIRSDIERDVDVEASVTGFYFRCREAGWDG